MNEVAKKKKNKQTTARQLVELWLYSCIMYYGMNVNIHIILGNIHLGLISIHTLLELWVHKDTFPNHGKVWGPYPATEETHLAWVLDLPFSPELMFHVEAAISGSPGTCFSEIRTTCEIFGTPIRPSTVERYGSQEY